jgi:hypothetical protein
MDVAPNSPSQVIDQERVLLMVLYSRGGQERIAGQLFVVSPQAHHKHNTTTTQPQAQHNHKHTITTHHIAHTPLLVVWFSLPVVVSATL